tara:strand:- start:244 stop:405 length:162 start_codon:yes stop_codon:yes gene_type:complete
VWLSGAEIKADAALTTTKLYGRSQMTIPEHLYDLNYEKRQWQFVFIFANVGES